MLTELTVKREKVLAPLFDDPPLTLAEAAFACHVSVSTLRNWIAADQVSAVHIGRKLMLLSSEVCRIRDGGVRLK